MPRWAAIDCFRSLKSSSALLIVCASTLHAQQPPAKELLAHALHLADLYNWADAAPAFTQAEKLFSEEGDRRNGFRCEIDEAVWYGRVACRSPRPIPSNGATSPAR